MKNKPGEALPPLPGKPMSPKEFSEHIGRSPRWVAEQCRRKKLPTCPPGRATT